MTTFRKEDYFVTDIDISEARELVEAHHYAKGASKTRVFTHGLFRVDNFRLVGVAWWLPPTRVACESVNRNEWKRVISLSRMVIEPGVPKNACSFLLARCVRRIRRDGRFVSLVTYADEAQSHLGTVYLAANWEFVGTTGPYPKWIDPATGRQVAALSTKTRTSAEMTTLGYRKVGNFYKRKFVLHLNGKPSDGLDP